MFQRNRVEYMKMLVGALLLVLFVPIRSLAQGSAGEWVKVETANFTILSQSGGEVARSVGADLERLHHTLSVLASSDHLDSPLPNYFFIFRDEASLAPYRQASAKENLSSKALEGRLEVIGGGAQTTAGYLVPHEHGNYAVVVGGEDFVPTRYVYKQYIHNRLHADHSSLPLWFRQGVAEYYSSFKTDGELALIGLPTDEHVSWIRHRPPLIPVAELIRMDSQTVLRSPSDRRHLYFKQSWALFHYLHNGREDTRERIPEFVQRVARGEPLDQAFAAYGVSPEQLDVELEEYLKKGSLIYLKVPVEKLDLLITKTAPLAQYETLSYLGELLARAVEGGEGAAAAHFNKALELNPEHGSAWAGLGYLSESSGDEQQARAHYQKAVAGSADDFLVQYLYGKSMLSALGGRRPADEAQEQALQQAIDALGRSVELEADFPEAWASLGYAYGLQTEASDAGVHALRRAMAFFPERSDLALNLLLAHARRGEREAAESVFLSMVESGADAGTLGRANEIRLQMDYRQAAQWVRKGDTDEAIALFVRIQNDTQDPGLKQKVDEQLEKLSIVGDFREFIDLYNAAARAINTGDAAKAAGLVDQLASKASEPWQRGQVKKLRRSLEAMP